MTKGWPSLFEHAQNINLLRDLACIEFIEWTSQDLLGNTRIQYLRISHILYLQQLKIRSIAIRSGRFEISLQRSHMLIVLLSFVGRVEIIQDFFYCIWKRSQYVWTTAYVCRVHIKWWDKFACIFFLFPLIVLIHIIGTLLVIVLVVFHGLYFKALSRTTKLSHTLNNVLCTSQDRKNIKQQNSKIR